MAHPLSWHDMPTLAESARNPHFRRVFGSWLYYIQRGDDGPIKIGTSGSPFARLKEMQTACPERLHMRAIERGSRAYERTMHEAWARHRIAGEWFRPAPDLLVSIAAIGLDAWEEGPLP